MLPPNHLKQAAALMAIAGLMDAETASRDFLLPGGPKGFSTFYGYYMLEALAKAGHYEEAMDIISRFWGGMLDMGATTFWDFGKTLIWTGQRMQDELMNLYQKGKKTFTAITERIVM